MGISLCQGYGALGQRALPVFYTFYMFSTADFHTANEIHPHRNLTLAANRKFHC